MSTELLQASEPELSLPICPSCGQRVTFKEHAATSVETHGLDCGPYERFYDEWLTCDRCGAQTTWDELAKINNDSESDER